MRKSTSHRRLGLKVVSLAASFVLAAGLFPIGALASPNVYDAAVCGVADEGEVDAPDTPVDPDTFFKAYVDDVQASGISYTADSYSYYDFMAGKTVKVGTFTVTIPAGTSKVTLTYPENRIVYNYDGAGNWLAGWYADNGVTGELSSTVSVDANEDGVLDFIQIQTPYDSSWNSTLLCAVTFRFGDGDEQADDLTNGLMKTFAQNEKYQPITNSTFFAALAMSASGKSDDIDLAALESSFETAEKDPYFSAGTMAKYILALSALGVDCTQYKSHNLVSEMEAKMADESGAFVDQGLYANVVILPVYQFYKGTESVENACKGAILATQGESGLFVGDWGADCQTTAQAVVALSGYDDEGAQAAITKAVDALKDNQNADGGFRYMSEYPSSDVDTTGNVVAALVAAGENVTSARWLTVDGKSPLSYLVDAADDDLSAYSGAYSPAMAASDALAGLASYQLDCGIYQAKYPELNPVPVDTTPVYRMYNAATSEHLWTTSEFEYNMLQSLGWTAEGIVWNAPCEGKGVYRLYNSALGIHHYTASANEISVLTREQGWTCDNKDKPMFYASENEGGTPVYRLYNESLSQHHISSSAHEIEVLTNEYGWNVEGIAFYM